MPNTKKDYHILLFWLAVALFVALYLILSYHNRLAADDFYYLANYPKVGVWGCMEYLYRTYSARWSAYLFTGAVVSFTPFRMSLLVFHLATMVSLIAVISLIIHQILNIRLKHSMKWPERVLYATLAVIGLFFTSYSIGETWFWVVQVCTYLWSLIMSLGLIYLFLNRRPNWIHYPLIILASLFIGGASESYALVNLFLMGSFLFFAYFHFSRFPQLHFVTTKALNQKLMVAMVCLLVGFAITMVAPGNGVRYEALPHPSKAMLLWIQMKSFIKIVFIRTPLNLPWLILFGTPWFLLGHRLQDQSRLISLSLFIKSTLPYLVGYLLLVFIFLIPTSLILAEIGPDRALSLVSFFVTLSFSAVLFWAGNRLRVSVGVVNWLKIGMPVVMVAVLAFYVVNQEQTVSAYARSYDRRMDYLKALPKGAEPQSVVTLDSLAPSGMLYSAEITTNPTHFLNQFLKEARGVEAGVKLKN